MNKTRTLICACAALAAFATGTVSAASVTWTLNQSNSLPDGPNYVQVTVEDGANGAVDFTVEALGPIAALAGDDFGFSSFAFNIAPGGDAEAHYVEIVDDGWKATDGGTMTGFGRFDILLKAKAEADPSPVLSFSVVGLDFDEIADYASLSTGFATQGHAFFAAKLKGFLFADGENGTVNQAFFADLDGTPVPLPATGWLFGAAGLLIARMARARKT